VSPISSWSSTSTVDHPHEIGAQLSLGVRGRIVVRWLEQRRLRLLTGLNLVPRRIRETRVRTYSPKASEITREWHIVDAEGLVLGRMATEVARVLRGKHKPTYAPHMDTGDHVIIINADKVVLTSEKAQSKLIHRHSGYPGGLKTQTYADLLSKRPAEAVRRSVRGMIPKNRLGRQQLTKLKVYGGPTHPHEAQKPQPLVLEHARARTEQS
jgi:large subunit ribosomal protein L13